LVLLTLAAYWPVLAGSYEFLQFDDDEYVTENAHIRGGLTREGLWWALTASHSNNWHPLTWVSLQLDYQLHGLDPWGYHATNVLLHAANAVLLFGALRRLTGSSLRSACVAAFFAVHPLHVESVAWVAERKDLLSTFFGMLTLLAYASYAARPGVLRYVLVLLPFALSLMAKSMLVTLPLLLLLLDWWPLRRGNRERRTGHRTSSSLSPVPCPLFPLILEKLPLFALSAGCIVLTVRAQGHARQSLTTLSPLVRVGNALVSYVAYAFQTVWPRSLAAFYPHPGAGLPIAEALGAAVLLALVTALVWWARCRPYLLVGWLWYLGTLVPVIGLVQVGYQARADRYTYVPLVGLFLLAVWGTRDLLARWRCPRPAAAVGVAALLAVCVGLTWQQLLYWRNGMLLWQHARAVTTENPFPHLGEALALEAHGRDEEAEEQYRLAVQGEGAPSQFHSAYGGFLKKRGRAREAEEQFEAALRQNPTDTFAHWNLGLLCERRGQLDAAREHYAVVARQRPDDPEVHYNLGVLLQREGELEQARQEFEATVRLRSGDAEALAHLGAILLVQGDLDGARRELRRALEINPQLADAYVNLGAAAWNEGKPDQARLYFIRALEINPRHRDAHHDLGVLCQSEGRADEAARHLAEAERLSEELHQSADPP
jgi:Tfp pilus assembly protein PilF